MNSTDATFFPEAEILLKQPKEKVLFNVWDFIDLSQ